MLVVACLVTSLDPLVANRPALPGRHLQTIVHSPCRCEHVVASRCIRNFLSFDMSLSRHGIAESLRLMVATNEHLQRWIEDGGSQKMPLGMLAHLPGLALFVFKLLDWQSTVDLLRPVS